MFWMLIFGFLAGFFKSIMDTIKFHRHSWIFPFFEEHFGKKAYIWLTSDFRITQNFWTHWIFGDGWHSSQNIVWVSVIAAIYFSAGGWKPALGFYLAWAFAFNVFFSFVFNRT